MSLDPTIVLAIPACGAVVVAALGRWPDLRDAAIVAVAGAMLLAVLTVLAQHLDGARIASAPLSVAPGLELALEVEPLGMLFALVAAILWLANSFFSFGYMRDNREQRQTSFHAFFAIALASTIGVAFAANLFTLFVFYEILTLSTYPLVTHKRSAEAIAAGRLYLLMLLGTSIVLMLPAIVWTLELAGTIEFQRGGILPADAGPWTVGLLLLLYVFGIGKAAVMPLHRWLPAAMVAPTPVSALLHAVAVVKAGVFAILKVMVYVFGIDRLADNSGGTWLVYVAGASVLLASLIALRQDNLKRRLAYSTISQLSYVVLAAAILTPLSVVGAALHILAHAFGKITLFLAAGSLYTAAHLTEVSQLKGAGRRMPLTMTAFAIGALAMIGIPPTAGFLGKWFMLAGAVESGQWWPVLVIVLSTGLTAGYFLPIVWSAFMQAPDAAHGEQPHAAADAGTAPRRWLPAGEASWPILLGLLISSAGTLLFFFASDLPFRLARSVGDLP